MHVADFANFLKEHEENRVVLYKIGNERNNEKYMRVKLGKIRTFLIMSGGLKKKSVFPEILQGLDRVVAPKTCHNVAKVLIDFTMFLREQLGQDGPNRYEKPESIKAQLKTTKERSINQQERGGRLSLISTSSVCHQRRKYSRCS